MSRNRLHHTRPLANISHTHSFPVEQTALDKGKLLTWTKGFAAKHAIGHDVIKLLQDALDRKHIHVQCSALVNDTVGTLLSRSYQNGPALIGAIFGTGTNGAYIDKVETIKKLGQDFITQSQKGGPDGGEFMVVNCEWGAIDNQRKVLPVSIFDNKVDRESINPRKQAFEKMVSGMYLGELVRNILLHLIDNLVLFDGHSTEVLNTHYGFDTSFVSAVEGTEDKEKVRSVIHEQLKVDNDLIKDQDVQLVQWACKSIATRASSLAACAIAAVVLHTHALEEKKDKIDVGIDGSVAEFLPNFEKRMRETLRLVIGDEGEKRITIGLAKDGSGVGGEPCFPHVSVLICWLTCLFPIAAALCALQAKKAQEQNVHLQTNKNDARVPSTARS